MAMSPRRMTGLQAHARGVGPEADIARRKLGMSVGSPMGGGPGTAITRRMPGAGGPRAIGAGRNLPVRAPMAIAGGASTAPRRSITTPVSLGATRRKSITTPVTLGPSRKPPIPAVKDAVDNARKLPKRGRGLMIGAGAAVIAGLAYSGRRGEGSSGGRTGMTRY